MVGMLALNPAGSPALEFLALEFLELQKEGEYESFTVIEPESF